MQSYSPEPNVFYMVAPKIRVIFRLGDSKLIVFSKLFFFQKKTQMFQIYDILHICQWSQWKVCSRPMRSFLPWLHGCHQFPFPASKFRVLLNIWFVLVDSENLIAFGGNSWCPYYNHFYYVSVHLLFNAVQCRRQWRPLSEGWSPRLSNTCNITGNPSALT